MTFENFMEDARRALMRAMLCQKHGTLHARGPQSEFFRFIVAARDFVPADDEQRDDVEAAARSLARYVAPAYDLELVLESKVRVDLCCPDMTKRSEKWQTLVK